MTTVFEQIFAMASKHFYKVLQDDFEQIFLDFWLFSSKFSLFTHFLDSKWTKICKKSLF